MLNQLIKFRKTTLIAIACLLPCFQHVSGENDTFIPVHLDGFNTVLFNQEYPQKSLNMYSLTYGNPVDQFPFNSFTWPDYDSLLHIQISAKLGSEIGDPLLNKYETSGLENRDHFTNYVTACTLPNGLLNLFFSYRYTDNYSDRFDKLWNRFTVVDSAGRKMKGYSVGLAHEIAGGITLNSPVTSVTLNTLNYKRWGTTPFYFSPLYKIGYLLRPSAFFKINKSDLNINFLFNYHRDYYDHIDYAEFTDEGWDITWERQLRNGIVAQISHHNKTELTPATHARAMLHDTIPNLLIWTLTGKVYGNMRPGGILDLSYTQIPKFQLNVNTAWDFIQKSRSYTFMEDTIPVEYHTKMYETNTLHSSLQYTDTLLFPVKASIWLNYCKRPLWETIDSTDDKIIIRQDTIDDAALLTCGGKGSYRVSYKKLSTTLWGNFSINPTTKNLRFEIPWNTGIDFAYGKPDNDSLYAAVNIESRGPTTLRYYNRGTDSNTTIITYEAPSQTGISLKIKIPFKMPFFREHLRTNFQIDAGPIHPFYGKTRLIEHPMGNPIGPAIALGLNGFFN